jgi:hypothetical protein
VRPKAVEEQAVKLLRAIELCFAQELYVAALVLLYSAIDGMAWLDRPSDDICVAEVRAGARRDALDVTQGDFETWVAKYLLGPDEPYVRPLDLYAARCALVHTQIGESRASRQRGAREFFYRLSGDRVLIPLGLNAAELPLEPPLDGLIAAFRHAVGRFMSDLDRDHVRAELVAQRAGKYYQEATYWPRRECLVRAAEQGDEADER